MPVCHDWHGRGLDLFEQLLNSTSRLSMVSTFKTDKALKSGCTNIRVIFKACQYGHTPYYCDVGRSVGYHQSDQNPEKDTQNNGSDEDALPCLISVQPTVQATGCLCFKCLAFKRTASTEYPWNGNTPVMSTIFGWLRTPSKRDLLKPKYFDELSARWPPIVIISSIRTWKLQNELWAGCPIHPRAFSSSDSLLAGVLPDE